MTSHWTGTHNVVWVLWFDDKLDLIAVYLQYPEVLLSRHAYSSPMYKVDCSDVQMYSTRHWDISLLDVLFGCNSKLISDAEEVVSCFQELWVLLRMDI